MRRVEILTKYYSVAQLIFVNSNNIDITTDNLEEIHNRFSNLVDEFNGEANTYIGKTKPTLPYNTMTALGIFNNRLILHFTDSFGEPLFFVYDIPTKTVKNYIDIEEAQVILDDDNYEDIRTNLKYRKNLSLIIPNVKDINAFVTEYLTDLRSLHATEEFEELECVEASSDEYSL